MITGFSMLNIVPFIVIQVHLLVRSISLLIAIEPNLLTQFQLFMVAMEVEMFASAEKKNSQSPSTTSLSNGWPHT